jgi:hypothetical protein
VQKPTNPDPKAAGIILVVPGSDPTITTAFGFGACLMLMWPSLLAVDLRVTSVDSFDLPIDQLTDKCQNMKQIITRVRSTKMTDVKKRHYQ